MAMPSGLSHGMALALGLGAVLSAVVCGGQSSTAGTFRSRPEADSSLGADRSLSL